MPDRHVSRTPSVLEPAAAPASVFANPSTLPPDLRARRRSRLRRLHLELGIDPGYLSLPAGMRLWLVTLVLADTICEIGTGFTRLLHEYALGADEAEAVEAVRRWWQALEIGTTIVRNTASLACADHPEELWSPQQVRRADMPALPPRKPALPAAGVDA